jgi:hypothetical protein
MKITESRLRRIIREELLRESEAKAEEVLISELQVGDQIQNPKADYAFTKIVRFNWSGDFLYAYYKLPNDKEDMVAIPYRTGFLPQDKKETRIMRIKGDGTGERAGKPPLEPVQPVRPGLNRRRR